MNLHQTRRMLKAFKQRDVFDVGIGNLPPQSLQDATQASTLPNSRWDASGAVGSIPDSLKQEGVKAMWLGNDIQPGDETDCGEQEGVLVELLRHKLKASSAKAIFFSERVCIIQCLSIATPTSTTATNFLKFRVFFKSVSGFP